MKKVLSARSSSTYTPKEKSKSAEGDNKDPKSDLKQYTNGRFFTVSQRRQLRDGLESGVDISVYADPKYDEYQMAQIRAGLEEGIDVSMYADPVYEREQMKQLRLGIEQGLDVSAYADPRYTWAQMDEIRLGLEDGVDVSVYAYPKCGDSQMHEIRLGLKAGVDVSIYADPERYHGIQMAQIRFGLEDGVDVSVYTDPNYYDVQMKQIRLGLEHGVDVSIYADPKYNHAQMKEIREGLEHGIDVSLYADHIYDDAQMRVIRQGLEEGLDVSLYADPKYDGSAMYFISRGMLLGLDLTMYAESLNWIERRPVFDWIKSHKDDPLIGQVPADVLYKAAQKDADSLADLIKTPNEKAKQRWEEVKQAAQDASSDVSEIEEQFNLIPLEGRAAYTLGLSFDENDDGSVTFLDNAGAEVETLPKQEYDRLVKLAISNSFTRQSFAKAFATQLKQALAI